ncbi:SO2930 family diheme c-type cytochrome [Arundinibacter roseus]|uniref:Uncharacterized protein n=1 Tax=Arundinibacter roseus TaxID=2070510 RepID=A0A4R4KE75_9BACT|nr:SO2930 family diheme c-type cytochrome [Arundinibacter roseus]TDB65993.1 hypothetical protein EZE20_09530 [Arundinibacter roseus]
MKKLWILFGSLLSIGLLSFHSVFEQTSELLPAAPKEKLSDYGFFEGLPAAQKPAEGVVPYRLNTPLFTDYAEKLRFVKFPDGQSVAYAAEQVLDFPVGTTLIKTFYFPLDARSPEKGRRLIETRLLIHEPKGWKALEYVWNEEQTDAFLEVAGDTKELSWVDRSGQTRTQTYSIPNLNQCKGCHNSNEKLTPIGPSSRQLNGLFAYEEGAENQLIYWQKKGLLISLPALSEVPKAAVWDDTTTGTVAERAREWLAINCAHCHRPEGPARTSGLFLQTEETNPTHIGIKKTPVAAGRGSGGRLYDIVPGHPEQSILVYRLESSDPGEMMPELGRKLVHQEGIALIKEWIRSIPE